MRGPDRNAALSKWTALLAFALGFAALSTAACNGDDNRDDACCADETVAARLAELQASCVVIVVDAAAAAHFAAYGYERPTTPGIDRLADKGVLFEQVYAQAPSTSPSVRSYLTGLYSHTLARRVEAGTSQATLYLPEMFGRAGFRTAGFSGNPIVELAIPGDEIFERFDGSARRKNLRAVPLPSHKVVRRALEWVDSVADERFFLYVHLLPPHGPYTPPEEHVLFRPDGYEGDLVPTSWKLHVIDRGRHTVSPEEVEFIVSQYDANLHYADALVTTLLDGLAARGVLDRSVVVLLADHGEAFGQHGRWVHTTTLYDEMIRVPWILSLPEAAGVAPQRVGGPVALLDLVPTLAELFSLEVDEAAPPEGVSLVPLLTGERSTPAPRMILSQNTTQVAAIEAGFKLILMDQDGELDQELYDLARDPAEARDLTAEDTERVARLRSAIAGHLEKGVAALSVEEAARTLSEESARQLQALGYLIPTNPEAEAPPEP